MDLSAHGIDPLPLPKGPIKLVIDFERGSLQMPERPEFLLSGLSQLEITHEHRTSVCELRIKLLKK